MPVRLLKKYKPYPETFLSCAYLHPETVRKVFAHSFFPVVKPYATKGLTHIVSPGMVSNGGP